MGFRMKNFNFMGVHWKICFFGGGGVGGGGVTKNQYIGENCLKWGVWTVCRFKGRLVKKEGVGVFEGGWYPNAHYEERPQKKNS